MWLVDGLRDPVERRAQLRLVVDRSRGDVRPAEQTEPHAAKPAQRAEAVTVTARCRDRALPVGAQPEVACAQLEGVPLDREADRLSERRRRAPLEQTNRLRAREPADTD